MYKSFKKYFFLIALILIPLIYLVTNYYNSLKLLTTNPPILKEEKLTTIKDEEIKDYGKPTNIIIDSLDINLEIKEGMYDDTSQSWTLDNGSAYWANLTDSIHSSYSSSVIYAHNQENEFLRTKDLKEGDRIRILTDQGEDLIFIYQYDKIVDPKDSSVLFEKNDISQIILITCHGIFSQNRRAMYAFLEESKSDLDYENIITNPSLEITSSLNNNIPQGWYFNNEGINDAKFYYLSNGYHGERSIKIEIRSYEDGYANWGPQYKELAGNQYYRFSIYYRSDTNVELGANFINSEGEIEYKHLSILPTSNAWSSYSLDFLTLDNTVQGNIFLSLTSTGYLITDKYSLLEIEDPLPFDQPYISLTFDDGFYSHYKNVFPLLKEKGINATFYIATNYVGKKDYMNIRHIKKLSRYGNEIGSHSKSHSRLTDLSETRIQEEILYSKEKLEKLLKEEINSFASPYGEANDITHKYISHSYKSHRSVFEGMNSKNHLDIYNLKVKNIDSETTLEHFKQIIEEARATKSWLILVYHDISDDKSYYSVTNKSFESQINIVVDSNIKVLPISKVLNLIH